MVNKSWLGLSQVNIICKRWVSVSRLSIGKWNKIKLYTYTIILNLNKLWLQEPTNQLKISKWKFSYAQLEDPKPITVWEMEKGDGFSKTKQIFRKQIGKAIKYIKENSKALNSSSNRFIKNTLHYQKRGITHPMQGTCIVHISFPSPIFHIFLLRPVAPLRLSLPLPLPALSVFVVFVRFLLLLARCAGIAAVASAWIAARIPGWRTTTLSAAWLRRSLRLAASSSCRRIILRILCVLAGCHALAVAASCRRRSCCCCRRCGWVGLLLAGIGTAALAGIGRIVLGTARCSILWLFWVIERH